MTLLAIIFGTIVGAGIFGWFLHKHLASTTNIVEKAAVVVDKGIDSVKAAIKPTSNTSK